MGNVHRVACAVILLLQSTACERKGDEREGAEETPASQGAGDPGPNATEPNPAVPNAAAPRTPDAGTAPNAPRKTSETSNQPSTGTAEISFSGGVTQKLEGPVVVCGHTFVDGRHQGGTWAVRTDDFDFQIMATTDAEFAEPTAVLNVKNPTRKSYVWKRKAGTVSAASDRTVATIDADLQEIVGAGTVHVKGQMTCSPR